MLRYHVLLLVNVIENMLHAILNEHVNFVRAVASMLFAKPHGPRLVTLHEGRYD